MSQLTAGRARELLDYDRDTGVCTWRISFGRARVGAVAGNLSRTGYIRIGIDGEDYQLHRVIFLLKTGEWPIAEIDHRDLDKSNNRWDNIRTATRSQNNRNRPRRRDNKSGLKGVSLDKGRYWNARIMIHGKQCYLGTFDTAEEAHAAYLDAAAKAFGEFYRAA